MAKASSRLGLSQPAISKAIADLEHTIGADCWIGPRAGLN